MSEDRQKTHKQIQRDRDTDIQTRRESACIRVFKIYFP